MLFIRFCEHAPRSVVNYMARYSHSTAISNQQILAMDEETMSFRYKDYGDHDRRKMMQLSHDQFIRHFGYLANCCRAKRLPQVRTAIAQAEVAESEPEEAAKPPGPEVENWPCPMCRTGRLRIVGELPARRPGGG